ncbi:MAG TPA: SOS response-associated peptidase [Gemmataceae bacterium]|nr:SOS response-associated peptidase [Gemmataceae bacterium]
MCGRFALKAPAAELATLFDVSGLAEVPPRYNIAPATSVLAVRQASTGREWVALRWGLIPYWASDPAIGQRLANARAETASAKPAFRQPFRSRRCLIPASGFYEWQRQTVGKAPYYIEPRGDQPLALAGLWDSWQDPEGQPVESCTILTTEANELLRPIHERMPVVVPPADFARWLDLRCPLARVQTLLRPYPSERLACYPISRFVNNTANDDPRCLEAIDATKSADAGGWLFGNPA